MRNLKLEIEYDGTNYCGWQIQRCHRKKKSLQETLEKTLQRIVQEKVRLIASGRTDAGVHAQAQTANFKTKSKISLLKLQKALNGLLPADIAVSNLEEKPPAFHSRFAARTKLYRYAILNRAYPCVFLRNTVYFYPYPLDVKLMQKEAKVLVGRHNFSSFAASDKKERIPYKRLRKITVAKDKDFIYIEMEADGFLYNMARNIVGTLIEIGRNRLSAGSLKRILFCRNRRYAGPTAPAKGLCLVKVKY